MNPYKKVFVAFVNDVAYWWTLAIFMLVITGAAAVNKWVVHLPGFPQW